MKSTSDDPKPQSPHTSDAAAPDHRAAAGGDVEKEMGDRHKMRDLLERARQRQQLEQKQQ